MSSPFIEIELGAQLAHFELDHRLGTDEPFVGIFGPSGAGKTSIIECIAGWRAVDRGRIRVGERVLFDSATGVDLPTRERGVGYVPQDVLLFPHWNVQRNVTAGARRREVRAGLVERVLAVLELEDLRTRPVRRLSGGEQRRVALARALCSEPDLLLLDEPLGSLDLPLRRRILGDLLRIRDEFRVPILLVSHDPTEVEVLCGHAQLLVRGRVEAEGHPADVVAAGVAGWAPEVENVLFGRVAALDGDVATVELEHGPTVLARAGGLAAGERAVLGLRADDVLLALEAPRSISARNVLPGVVTALDRGGCRVRLAGGDDAPTVGVHVTEAAARELALAPGLDVHLVVKTRSLRGIASVARRASGPAR